MIPHKFKNWVKVDKLDNSGLSMNQNAVYYLSKNKHLIDRQLIIANDSAYILLDELIKKNEIDIGSASISNHPDIELLYKNNKSISLDFFWLSGNRNAINLLNTNNSSINYSEISGNPGAIDIIQNLSEDRIDYTELSRNPNAIKILKGQKDKIDWSVLSGNSKAIRLLSKNPDKIDFENLSYNYNIDHPLLYKIIRDNLDKLDWSELSANPAAINILIDNFDRIDWDMLCQNPNGVMLLSYYPEKINWSILSANYEASELFEENVDKIDWFYISSNPCIFELDYETMKNNLKFMRFDLMKAVWLNTIYNMTEIDLAEDITNIIISFI
jgi:hypothetical protein